MKIKRLILVKRFPDIQYQRVDEFAGTGEEAFGPCADLMDVVLCTMKLESSLAHSSEVIQAISARFRTKSVSQRNTHLYVIVLICAKLIINCLDDAWSMHGSRRSDSILGFYGAYL